MRKYIFTLFFICTAFICFAQDNYNLSSESKLTIEGTSTVHDWIVTANTLDGFVKVDSSLPKEIDFQVTVADIKSERGATMDTKMHAALLNETHPKVMFKLKEVKNESALIGNLTIAGKEQEVELKTNIDSSSDNLIISGEYGIVLKDFEIEPPTAMFGQVIVGDTITVKFDLVFEKE